MEHQRSEWALRKIQRWYRGYSLYQSLKKNFLTTFPKEKFHIILSSLVPYSSTEKKPSFEICQATLFNAEFFEIFSNFISEIFYQSAEFNSLIHFNDFHHQHPHEGKAPSFQGLTQQTKISSSKQTSSVQKTMHKTFIKTLLSSYMIANFPSDILESSQSSNPVSPKGAEKPVNYSELKQKSQVCFSGSKLCIKYISKLLDFIDKFWYSTKADLFKEMHLFHRLVQKSLLAFQSYLTSFHEWKRLDSLLIIQSLEETFQQSYLAFLLARKELEKSNDPQSSELVKSSELQFIKIQDMLKRIVGPKNATSRIEEIKASVQAANTNLVRNEGDTSNDSELKNEPSEPQHDLSSLNENIKAEVLQIPSVDLTQGNTAEGKSGTLAMKQLEMLSRLAGVENERLAYEITLDKHYRLPVKHQRLLKEFSSDPLGRLDSLKEDQPKGLADILKDRILLTMADKLINSLRKSPISSFDEVSSLSLPFIFSLFFLHIITFRFRSEWFFQFWWANVTYLPMVEKWNHYSGLQEKFFQFMRILIPSLLKIEF
jgi:hypothetical protein